MILRRACGGYDDTAEEQYPVRPDEHLAELAPDAGRQADENKSDSGYYAERGGPHCSKTEVGLCESLALHDVFADDAIHRQD